MSALGSPQSNTLPASTFQSQYAGKLTILLIAYFSASQYRDAGFPSSGGSAGGTNVAVRGRGGPSGGQVYTAVVDKYNLTASILLDYPGGNVAWPVGVDYLSGINDMSGIYSISMDVELVCKLEKKT